jgi:uncharacterized membrane protein
MLDKGMRGLLALLALAGLVVSVLALRVHNMDPSSAPPCAVTEKFDCGTVNHSRFAVFPPTSFDEDPASKKVHIPVATFGIGGYALMLLVALTGRWWILLQLAEIGFAAACMLTYLEAYVIQKWCIYCLWSQGIVAAILLATILALLTRRRAFSPVVT